MCVSNPELHRFIVDYSRLVDLENTNFDDALDALLD